MLMPILFKSSVVLTAFIVVYYLVLYKSSHFNINRTFLIIGMLLTLSIPFIDITYPVYVEMQTYDSKEQIVTIPEEIPEVPVMKEVEPIKQSIDWKIAILWIYVVVSILLTLKLLSSLMYGFWLLTTAQKIKWKSSSIYIHHRVKNPMVFGSWIFIRDKSYLEPEKEQVLIHELIHKKQNHWIDMLLSELLLIICWINPLTLVYRKAVQNNLEYIADRGVLNTGLQLNSYIQSILCETMGAEAIVLANHFRTSQNKQRLKMMKNVKQSKWGKFKLLLILPLTGILLWAFSEREYVYQKVENANINEHLLQKKDSVEFTLSPELDTLMVKQKDGTWKMNIIAADGFDNPLNATVIIKNKGSINFTLPHSRGYIPVNYGDTLVCSRWGYDSKEVIYKGEKSLNVRLIPKQIYKPQGTTAIYDTVEVRKNDGTYETRIVVGNISDVNVVIKGTTLGTFTDKNGEFKLKVCKGDVLVFSHVGYKTKKVKFIGQKELYVEMTQQNYHVLSSSEHRENFYGKPELQLKLKEVTNNKKISNEFVAVEQLPQYKYGIDGFFAQLYSKSAQIAEAENLSGNTNVVFTINQRGNLHIIKTFGNKNSQLNKAAIQIIEELNEWTPATQRGKNASYTFCVKVEF